MPTIVLIVLPLMRGAALLGLVLVGCGASPPAARDGQGPKPGVGAFASLARCTSGAPPACPGSSCADNAAGAVDGKTVDLAACSTLDLAFTGGTILSKGSGADLAFHLGALAGLTRVEASGDGRSYVIIGFIAREAELPALTNKACAPVVESPTQVTLSLGACNTIAEGRFLRLSRDSSNAAWLTLDAVEALSFAPASP